MTYATLPLVPTNTGVVLPGMTVSMALETPEARAAVEAGNGGDGRVVLVPRVGGRYAAVGTVAQIEQAGQLPGGVAAAVVRGVSRARIGVGLPGTGTALWVQVEPVGDPDPSERALELAREVRAVMENVLEHRGASQIAETLRAVTDPGALADLAGYSPDLSFEQKVELLETVEVEARLERLLGWMRDVLADLSLRERIRNEVTEGMERTQRDFLLRQQLAAIRKELGEADETTDAIEEYRSRLSGLEVPDPARKAIEREIARLERTSEQSPEHGWIRTWLDTIFELPWGSRSEDHLDLGEARRTLDADHTGLSDVKERIVEYLAVRKRRADRGLAPTGGRGSGVILALVGPPGVGKTSLGESVARALGRSFVRVALGGTRDEAEIRGHRRTYVGAQPGRIARALTEAGTMNPVFMLDEVDKLGADWRGDPSSALLEVLDPAQNHTFRDHYLEVDLDLSEVLFIATANVADTIPGPLLDRMELIRIDGYTEDEKVAIGRDHLLVRQRERNGLEDGEVEVSDAALRRVAAEYTREAGVRGLERELGRMLRKVATRLTAGELAPPVRLGADDVASYLGRPKFFFEAPDRT
ncbi:MAG TPA: LON peptidase substrate-binding domain-containing protein, partial [Acidimicrobiales bacterium]|nr:LON peptidase substrate-binding domain-containing protein [Acidimicrobiales bacterium]